MCCCHWNTNTNMQRPYQSSTWCLLPGQVTWQHAAAAGLLLFGGFCCWLLLIQYLAKWHSVNDMDVKAVIMGRSKRKTFPKWRGSGKTAKWVLKWVVCLPHASAPRPFPLVCNMKGKRHPKGRGTPHLGERTENKQTTVKTRGQGNVFS